MVHYHCRKPFKDTGIESSQKILHCRWGKQATFKARSEKGFRLSQFLLTKKTDYVTYQIKNAELACYDRFL